MTNPFDLSAPAAPPRGPAPGTLDISLALREGWDGMSRNFLTILVGSIVAGLLSGFSLLLCIVPFFIVGPAVAWGTYRAQLDALDGNVEFGTYFSGFQTIGGTVVPFLIYFLVAMVLSLPPMIASGILGLFDPGDSAMVTLLFQVVSTIISVTYNAVLTSRLMLAPFLIVDRNMAPVDAMAQSWESTGPVWGQIIGLSFVSSILPLVGLCACIVGVFPAAFTVAVAQASAYRQIMGRA